MSLEEIEVGMVVVVVGGPVSFIGRKGRVVSKGNGSVRLSGKFDKGRDRNGCCERCYCPEHVAPVPAK